MLGLDVGVTGSITVIGDDYPDMVRGRGVVVLVQV